MSIKYKSKRLKRSRSRSNKRSNKRKMGGGSGNGSGSGSGIGVKIESGSLNKYMNPINSALNCPGCKSDNTTGIGSYFLNKPLPDFPPSWNRGIMSGGGGGGGASMGNPIGGACSQPPLQFAQKGGNRSRKMSKGRRGKGKGRRGMKGGNATTNNILNFIKTNSWSADKGGNVIAPSTNGISPSGANGPPVSTAANPPMPKYQDWPTKLMQTRHAYQMGGGRRSKTAKKGRGGRSRNGGNIINDIQNFGRGITYNLGKVYNDLSGYSNKIYAANPIPSFGQFPKGLSEPKYDKYTFNPNLPKIYHDADKFASKI
jgi:hypothetical protein